MQPEPTDLSKLPPRARRLLVFDPDGGDALAFVAEAREAADVLAEWLAAPEAPKNRAVTQLVLTFARAVGAQADHAAALVGAGYGLQGREPEPILGDLAEIRARLRTLELRLDAVLPRPGALALLEAAAGVLKGEASNAMDDERAL